MRFDRNTKYNTYALLALIVAAFTGILISFTIHADDVRGFFSKMWSVFAPIFYAAVIMLILLPAVELFEKKLTPHFTKKKNGKKKATAFAILFTYLIVTVLLVLAVWIIIPQFSVLYDFIITSKDYLSILDNIGKSLADKSELLGERFLELVEKLKDSIVSSLSELTSLVPSVVNTFGDVLSEASNLLIGTIISIYALASRKRLKALGKKICTAIFPERAYGRITRVTELLYNNTVWFCSARAYNSIILGVVFYFVLLLMGLRFHSVLCLIIAFCNFIPVFGMLVGGFICTMIVLVTDTRLTVWFIAVYLALTVLGFIFVRPRITNKEVRLTLGTTMVCVLAGYFLGRLWGAIFAIPVYVTLRGLFRKWEQKQIKKKEQKEQTVRQSDQQ